MCLDVSVLTIKYWEGQKFSVWEWSQKSRYNLISDFLAHLLLWFWTNELNKLELFGKCMHIINKNSVGYMVNRL